MKKPSDGGTKNFTRELLIGMGEASVRKSYYPELQERMSELERFRLLLDQAGDPIVLMDLADEEVVDANAAARHCLGWDPGSGAAVDIRAWLGIDPAVALSGGQQADERSLPCSGGGERTVELSYSRAELDGRSYCVIVARDISERKEAQERLRDAHEHLRANYLELEELYGQLAAADEAMKEKIAELERSHEALAVSESRYRLATEGSKDGIWEWDIGRGRLIASESWSRVTGFPAEAPAASVKDLTDYIHPDDAPQVDEMLTKHLAGKTDSIEIECRFKTTTPDRWLWVLAKGKALFEDGWPVRVAGSLTDITARREQEERIRFLAYHDSLTGLLNRAGFSDALTEFVAAARLEGRIGAVFLLDLDNFKLVNDSRGHAFGDELLRDVAARLKAALPQDAAVARLGGDEFAAAFSLKEFNQYIFWAERFMSLFDRPAFVMGTQVMVSCSLGIAQLSGGSTADELLRKADTALHSAKSAGKMTWRVYERYMQEAILRRTRVESELHRALTAGEFVLHYQPQLCLATGRIVGFEALLRWARGGGELVSPLDFIPVAEETGLIVPIGEWVLRTACRFGHLAAERLGDNIRISVNVSPRQISQADFVTRICCILEEENFPPNLLEIEITETATIDSYELTVSKLRSLRAKGIRVALDDFGTGYSSLTYLSRLPADTLKIDKSFLREADVNPTAGAIIGTIVGLAHRINLAVVAEGVETQPQRQILANLGCDLAQGFLFSRPVAGETALALGPVLDK